MGVTAADIVDAVESGSTDRVNAVIDALESLDQGERIAVFEDCFDRCRELFGAGDGYQRQSVVRILDTLNPALALAAFVMDEGSRFPDDRGQAQYRAAVARLQSFLLTALQDDDGRVRQASKRALKQLCIGYDMIGEHDEIVALVEDLERVRAAVDDEEVRDHVVDAQEQAEFYLQAPAARLLEGLADDLGTRDQLDQ